MAARIPRNATTPVATPSSVFGPETEVPGDGGVPGRSRTPGRNRNSHLAPYISQQEAHKKLGINPKTLREWRAKGCDAFDDKGKVNLGKLIEWREALKYDEGANQERMHQASEGTMTVAQMEAQMKYLQLMKATRGESIEQKEWVLLGVMEANVGRMLGRIRAILRVMPEVVDPELELAMADGVASSAKRKAILRDAVEEVCRIVTMERVLHGDPEDRDDDDLEQRLAEAAEADDE